MRWTFFFSHVLAVLAGMWCYIGHFCLKFHIGACAIYIGLFHMLVCNKHEAFKTQETFIDPMWK